MRLALAGLLAAALTAAGCGAAPGARAHPHTRERPARHARTASHVVLLVMENEEATSVVGSPQAPYLTRLARRYGLATRSTAIAHPSLPDYVALTQGSTQGIAGDCTDCTAPGPSIADQLAAAGLRWRAYLEGLPRPCFAGAASGRYVKRHNPFAYEPRIAGSPRRCRDMVGFGALRSDLRRRTLPAFAFVAPDLCHDMHDCPVRTGDRFLAGLVPSILRALGPRGVLIVTWDEGSSDVGGGGRIATIVAGPGARRGARLARPVDHYGTLATIEDLLGLGRLGAAANPRSGSLLPLTVSRLRGG